MRSSSRLGTASRASAIWLRKPASTSLSSATTAGSKRVANSAASRQLIDACRASVASMYCWLKGKPIWRR